MKICKVKNCNIKHDSKGYCHRHYMQVCRYGKILKRTKFDPNEIIDCGDYYEICLYSGQGEQKEVTRTKIDKEDLEKVKNYKWYLHNEGYVGSGRGNDMLLLHHLILPKKEGYIIDHKNHNKLDNRLDNLRYATYSQNSMNRKIVKGYYWNKVMKKWEAYLNINYKKNILGYFIKEQDAVEARRKAELKYFGKFVFEEL